MTTSVPLPLQVSADNQLLVVRKLAEAVTLLQGGAGDTQRAVRVSELEDAGITARGPDGKLRSGKVIQGIQTQFGELKGTVDAAASGFNSLVSRVDNHDGILTIQSQQLTQLSATLDGVGGELAGLKAAATATQELLTQITAQQDLIDVLSQATTNLQADLGFTSGALGDNITANASAIDTLTARVTDDEGEITAQASRITALEATVNDPSTGVDATASALSALTTRVTTNEGNISSNSSSITSLNNAITTKSFLSGTGLNLLPDEYSVYTASALPTFGTKGATATLSRDAAVTYAGFPTLKVAATGSDAYVFIAASSTDYNIPVTGGKSYLFSAMVRCDQASKNVQFYFKDDTGYNPSPVPWTQATSATANTFTRLTWVVTPAAGAKSMCVRIDNEGGAGCNMWFTQLMVEEQAGSGTTPSTWAHGPAFSQVAANASATSALDTRVTAAEGTISSHSTSITTLQSNIAAIGGSNFLYNSSFEEGVAVSANTRPKYWFPAINGAGAGTLSSYSLVASALPQSANACQINGTGMDLNKYIELSTNIGEVGGSGWGYKVTPGKKHTLSVSARGTAGATFQMYIQYRDSSGTVVQTNQLSATTMASATAWTRYTVTGAAAPSTAVTATVYPGRLYSPANGSALTLELDNVQFEEGEVATAYNPSARYELDAQASATSSLTTRVSTNEGNISANASDITSLTTTVNGHTSTISSHTTSINGLLANYSLQLDVNGYITGFEFNNDGTTGDFKVRADKFSILDPNGTNSIILSSGVLQSVRSGRSMYMGAGFATPGYLIWSGPSPATPITGATDAAADFYVKTDGSAYFGGTLSAAKVIERLSGRGTNIMWDEYTRFNKARLPDLSASDITHVTFSYDPATSLPSSAGGSLKCAVNDATGSTTNSYVRFANTVGDYPVRLESGKKYIVSASFKASVGGSQIAFFCKTDDGVVRFLTPTNINVATSFTRLSAVLDLTGITTSAGQFGAYLNRTGITTPYTVWTDQWMVEELVGADATPSTWTTGSTARLVDGKASTYFQASAPYTSGGVEGDTWTDSDTMIAYRWSVSSQSWVMQNAYVAASVGANLIANPSFVLNALGVPADTVIAKNSAICDGWIVSYDWSSTSGGLTGWTDARWHSPTRPDGLFLAVNKPVSIANGTVVASQVRTKDIVQVRPNEQYLVGFSGTPDFNGTATANVTFQARLSVQWLTSAGASISTIVPTWINRGASGVLSAPEVLITAPSNAYGCYIYLDAYVKNNTGATWTHDSTVAYRFTFNSAYMVKKVTNTRGVPGIMVGNGSAKVPTAPTYSATAGSPATATISIPAFTVLSGSLSIPYNAMSVGVTGTGGTSVDYFLYCDDVGMVGGSQTLVATTNGNTAWQGDDRVYLGTIHVTFPTSGTGSGSGSGGGSGGSCVVIDQLLGPGYTAADVKVGHIIDCLDLPLSDNKFRRAVRAVRIVDAQCVRITTNDGAMLDLSVDTPFDLLDGRVAFADAMLGEYVITDRGIEQVVKVEHLGMRPVAKISVGGVSYAAGHDATHRIFSHNPLKP